MVAPSPSTDVAIEILSARMILSTSALPTSARPPASMSDIIAKQAAGGLPALAIHAAAFQESSTSPSTVSRSLPFGTVPACKLESGTACGCDEAADSPQPTAMDSGT